MGCNGFSWVVMGLNSRVDGRLVVVVVVVVAVVVDHLS